MAFCSVLALFSFDIVYLGGLIYFSFLLLALIFSFLLVCFHNQVVFPHLSGPRRLAGDVSCICSFQLFAFIIDT